MGAETLDSMQMRANLSQRQEQRLALLPGMMQSIEVLQLATADLLGLIETELERNEVLEVEDVVGEPEPPPAEGADEDWGEDLPGPRLAPASDGADYDPLSNVPAAAPDLLDLVRQQLSWWDLPDGLSRKVLALAQHLDHRGFLTESDAELLDVVGDEMFGEALEILQHLEPRGLGARNAVEALLLQLSPDDPDRADIARLLTDLLEPVARNKLPEVARRLGRSIEEVRSLLERIRSLDPWPLARFSAEVAGPIRPDIVVRESDGRLEVTVDDASLPSLGINEDYASLARARRTEAELRRYLRDKLDSAQGLIRAVEQRNRTLARVAAVVMEHQRDFLRAGEGALRPLSMGEVAELLGLHTSTVSRAVAGKYVQTDRGIYALRTFFDGGRTGGGDVGAGRGAVRQAVAELVGREDPLRPLSDDDLAEELGQRGMRVARRTVAKYRKELGIPSSWRRRDYSRG